MVHGMQINERPPECRSTFASQSGSSTSLT